MGEIWEGEGNGPTLKGWTVLWPQFICTSCGRQPGFYFSLDGKCFIFRKNFKEQINVYAIEPEKYALENQRSSLDAIIFGHDPERAGSTGRLA